MIKILAACGAGINSSNQIKEAVEKALTERGYNVKADAVVIKDINEDMLKKYDIFTPISKPDLGFEINIPIVEAGPILYRMPAMAEPVYNELEKVIKDNNLA